MLKVSLVSNRFSSPLKALELPASVVRFLQGVSIAACYADALS